MNNKKNIVVFPGQGSQSVGMLKDLANNFLEVTETFSAASDVLGYDLWELVSTGPKERLDQTVYTQPAVLTASVAIWRILQKHCPIQPAYFAGHSLGEYTALVCSQSVAFRDAVKLVALRGQWMQEAVANEVGAMAAIIGLEDDQVKSLCEAAVLSNEVLEPANFNSIGQVVIAGHDASVKNALELAKAQGAKLATLIPVSVPSHCRLMLPAAKKLAVALNEIAFQQPKIAVLNNVDVKFYTNAENIRDGLVRQLYHPVRWVEIMQTFVELNVDTIIECGPGKVLNGLNKRINKELNLINLNEINSLEEFMQVESRKF